MTIIESGGEIE